MLPAMNRPVEQPMDLDTKRWIFDITVWMAGIFAVVLLIAEATARSPELRVAASTMPQTTCVDRQPAGAIRGEG
jgi:hypothetical protein